MSEVKSYLKIGASLIVSLLFLTVSAQSIDEARGLYNEGGEAVQGGDLETGVQKFVECIDMCQVLVDDYEDAEAEELLTTVQQNVPKLYYQIGMDKIKSSQVPEGLENLYKAKETAEEYGDDDTKSKTEKVLPKVHYKIAASKYKGSDLEGAIAELDKAINVDNNYASAYYLKAVIYKSQDNDEQFAEAAKKTIEVATASNDTETASKTKKLAASHFLKKGNDAKEASKYSEAIKNLKASLEFDDSNSTVYYLITSTYNAQEKWDDAIASGKDGLAHETGTEKARFYYEIGTAYAGKGDKTAACEAFSKANEGDYAQHANYQIEHVLKCNE